MEAAVAGTVKKQHRTKYFNLQFAQAVQHKPGLYQATPAAMMRTAVMIQILKGPG